MISKKIEVERSLLEACIRQFRTENKRMFLSSSFQTHSIPMLHLLTNIDPSIPVYFVDTGFHFPETMVFMKMVSERLSLNTKVISSEIPKIDLITRENRFLFTSDPDLCCHLNKVSPIDRICAKYDVWISGVRGDQSEVRREFGMIAEGKNGITRFHPMINWDDDMIAAYIQKYELPAHPLSDQGYDSVGCSPCTSKSRYQDRSGRWVGMSKTECGLHLGVKSKKA